jgi:hypothetical protein
VSLAAGFSLLSMTDSGEPPHATALGLLPMLAIVFGGKRVHENHTPRSTTLLMAWFCCDLFGTGAEYVYNASQLPEASEHTRQWTLVVGIWYGVCGVLCAPLWWHLRRRHNQTHGARGTSPTVTFYLAIYMWFLAVGVGWVMSGISGICDPVHIPAGCLFLLPVVVLLVGRERVYGYVARRYERQPGRMEQDGAFMAELLDSSSAVEVGQDWWVHRAPDEKDHNFPRSHRQHNWRCSAPPQPTP